MAQPNAYMYSSEVRSACVAARMARPDGEHGGRPSVQSLPSSPSGGSAGRSLMHSESEPALTPSSSRNFDGLLRPGTSSGGRRKKPVMLSDESLGSDDMGVASTASPSSQSLCSPQHYHQFEQMLARKKLAVSGKPGNRDGTPRSPHLHPRPALEQNYKGSASMASWRDYTDDVRNSYKGAVRGSHAPIHFKLTWLTPKALKAGVSLW
eukprot:TRINITY_DN51220_c0_g1_i1.p1 TRINITY_DN51220_c0_g1~~TRINITY_DN51220_c0_g1_i1.p1  ORF type:complete len:234 (-),score=16.61 TRINITY_DN51220_c0_g1_i1:89-712(-)